MKSFEIDELYEVDKLKQRIEEILRMVEEKGESIDVTRGGKVIAHLIPASEPEKPVKRDSQDFLERLDRLAAEIGAAWKGNMDAVEAVRDVRRDL
ncbi:MAG TPA: hypothetical protein VFA09_06325 [Ktedonobacteraceae bacterium]|nr:hypothetical protein [Ktedonobacteraceae bacterium]